jgi:hypothetical protein
VGRPEVGGEREKATSLASTLQCRARACCRDSGGTVTEAAGWYGKKTMGGGGGSGGGWARAGIATHTWHNGNVSYRLDSGARVAYI